MTRAAPATAALPKDGLSLPQLTLGFVPFAAVMPDLAGAGLMSLLGVLGVISHLCMILAFAAAPANVVAPFGYTALLWATASSLLIFGEVPTPRSLFGAALIVGAGLFIFLRGRKI